MLIVHYDTSAMKRFLTSVSLQHEPKASDVITLVKKTFHRTSIVRNFISGGVKMRISARGACVKPHLRTRSDIKNFILPFFRRLTVNSTSSPYGKKTIQNYSENHYLKPLRTIVTIHQC